MYQSFFKTVQVTHYLAITLLVYLLSSCGSESESVAQPESDLNTAGYIMGGSIQGVPLNLSGNVITFSGEVGVSGSNHSSINVPISASLYSEVNSITTDGAHIYLADTQNHTIRVINVEEGTVNIVAGLVGNNGYADGLKGQAQFSYPSGITFDGKDLYVADTGNCVIRKITLPDGKVTTIAGSNGNCSTDDGVGGLAAFNMPFALTTDGKSIYVLQSANPVVVSPSSINLRVLRKISIETLEVVTIPDDEKLGLVDGITTNGEYIYTGNCCVINKINIKTNEITALAGFMPNTNLVDGVGSAARFEGIHGITSDSEFLYIADNHTVRKLELATNQVTTIAGFDPDGGCCSYSGYADGVGFDAKFGSPLGITTEGTKLYLSDGSPNYLIRVIE